MELSEYLTPQRVAILNGSTKADALEELVGVLVDSNVGVGREELRRTIWQREKMMSTGIGHGLAIPHVRMPGLTTTAMAVGVSRNGISDYPGLDEQPVYIIVLIAAPQGQHEIYIRLLAKVTDVLRHSDLRQAVIMAEDAGEIYRILTETKT
jgi:mannitol/fructose-specific phosphotransferase system IIA component (Ntr-type)